MKIINQRLERKIEKEACLNQEKEVERPTLYIDRN
jgi:hypothetical protein